jgi:hypothetical protein
VWLKSGLIEIKINQSKLVKANQNELTVNRERERKREREQMTAARVAVEQFEAEFEAKESK